ncbi:MAG: hypothetical protein Q9174_002664 [Haloplaca sp. 1 TL-2023]
MITKPRTVAAAMGNVVRRFYIVGASGPDEPASKELEDSVVQLFSDRGDDIQRVSIWALVEKPTMPPPMKSHGMRQLILKGRHLHRVLSGGGGWGNKQGLLSLDPEQDFNGASNTSPFDSVDVDNGTGLSFGQTVSPGDVISFWRGPLASDFPGQSVQPAALHGPWEIPKEMKSIVLGTAPSMMDNMPSEAQAPMDLSKLQDYIYIRQQFSMLSEKGFTFGFERADGQRVQTKIDSPGSSMVVGGREEWPLMKRVEIADEDKHLDPRIPKTRRYTTSILPEARLKASHNARTRNSAPSGPSSEPSSEYLTTAQKTATRNSSNAWSLPEAVAQGTTHSVLSGLETWQAKDLENPPTNTQRIKVNRYPSTPATVIPSFRKIEAKVSFRKMQSEDSKREKREQFSERGGRFRHIRLTREGWEEVRTDSERSTNTQRRGKERRSVRWGGRQPSSYSISIAHEQLP